jgi:hypothetical protein
MKTLKIKGKVTDTFEKFKALQQEGLDPYYTKEHLEVNVTSDNHNKALLILFPERKCPSCGGVASTPGFNCQSCCVSGKAYGKNWSLD